MRSSNRHRMRRSRRSTPHDPCPPREVALVSAEAARFARIGGGSDAFKALVTRTNGIQASMSWRQWIREIAELQRQEQELLPGSSRTSTNVTSSTNHSSLLARNVLEQR